MPITNPGRTLHPFLYQAAEFQHLLLLLLQVLFFEFLVSVGSAILTMPHLDIVTNATILNAVAVLSALLQVITHCTAKERNCVLLPSITAFILILLGYILFLILYIMKGDTRMSTWVGLAVGGSFLVSFNWYEKYFRVIGEDSSSIFLKKLCKDMTKCQNVLHILSSLLRIVVTASVLGAYVPLSKMDWGIVNSIPSRETRIIVITIGVQLISSALCHWFALAACKMHALRRCFILPLYLASLAVMAVLVIPVIVYYQIYRRSLSGATSINFPAYCTVAVDGRNQSLNDSVFPHLVLDVTHTLLSLQNTCNTMYFYFFNIQCWKFHLLFSRPSGSAVSWWISLVMATIYLWRLKVFRFLAFIEQSLLLNIRFDVLTKKKKKKPFQTAMVYLCATMWHETYDEMMTIIISIFRLDRYRPKTEAKFDDFTFEAHIFFDDAFIHYKLLSVLSFSVISIFTNLSEKSFRKQRHIPDQKIIQTPYGGRLVITMPHGNNIVVHFKNKERIRHKKRWSQVMYLYYLLGWKLMNKYFTRCKLFLLLQREKHNTYILALDGDTDFQPAAVMLLIDRLKLYPRVGAACGRIHPTGSGYHWLQKTAEHVFGSVLCSPGCFSLFRAEALMDDNVMKKYATKSTEASHYIQYDQGEDRWLCTLMLKQGWRVEYNAASDAYTNAPEEFKESHWRRRWGPSTLGNVADLLGSTSIVSKRNPSISKLFMFYQLFAMVSGHNLCICELVLVLIFPELNPGSLKADTQITVAAVLSIIYAFLMLVVMMSIIGAMVKEKTILTPSSMFIVIMALIYIVTAILHPQEFPILFYGFLYIICIPSAYLLLTIYSMVNMNNVSWGTRETKPAPGAAKPAATSPQTPAQKAKVSFHRLFTWVKCCKISSRRSEEGELGDNQENLRPEPEWPEPQPQNSIVEDIGIAEVEERYVLKVVKCKLSVTESDEQEFWCGLQKKYLEPLPDDKEKQKKIANDLRELRNKINFAFFMLNAMWLMATFTLQHFSTVFAIKFPEVDLNLHQTGNYIQVEPIGFMFILGFATSAVIQFFAMLFHRIYTLIHYVAFLETEPKPQKPENEEAYLAGEQVFAAISIATTNSNLPSCWCYYYHLQYWGCCYELDGPYIPGVRVCVHFLSKKSCMFPVGCPSFAPCL
uniref:chitin synthase n=1 Tax=Monopterus albus TaxID=43700 RepID=A0A3Q3KAL0_MONAL